ncbi:hypothetical protein [Gordonia rhizosphera]|uniref:Uncharacterized protein n=1 Tax=Gordonia rhizosphera NBRC 16068 TaxID=1108045 RepID=K6VXY7_9ACTN|nr:hypothetical protein [Gordonia rhizosphera]GAB91765.1 hypothetical protein GORHZ_145_00210 [Gordonia rhizosphera NBRC 16068]
MVTCVELGAGTLVAWSSLVAVAGFARDPVIGLARKCFRPAVSVLIVSTVIATYLLWIDDPLHSRCGGSSSCIPGSSTPFGLIR